MEWRPGRWRTSSGALIGAMLQGEKFRCALCRGKGVLPSAKARCPACGGRGSVSVNPPARICAYCNGRGEVPARSGITCIVCVGKGIVSVREPMETCQYCRGTGAAPNSKLPCLVCRGKGVVTTKENAEVVAAVRGDPAERPQIQRATEPNVISVYQVSLPPDGHEAGEGREAGYVWQPQRRTEVRRLNPGVVGGLVRRLMATERARMLGRKAIDLGRYALEKRTQRWRESRKRFK